MKLCLFLFIIASNLLISSFSIDVNYLLFKFVIKTDLWAFVLSTSDKFENYRHSINSLMIYNFLKKNGIPDERIVLGLSEFHACTPYSYYPGELYLTESSNILESCNHDINMDYKDSDFHNFEILDILKGRSNQLINNFSKIKSNKNSRILIIITAHGGENFIKVRGKSVILSDDLNRALNEMYIKERYKEILFIVDTCEGGSLFDFVDVPNVYFVASSMVDQKSNSYSYDTKYMAPTADRFHFKLHQILQKIHQEKSFKKTIHSIFLDIKSQKNFLETDVAIINKIDREILFEEFFGNPTKKHHINEKYNMSIQLGQKDSLNLKEDYSRNFNFYINEEINKLDKEILEMKKFKENVHSNIDNFKYLTSPQKNDIKRELIDLKTMGSSAFMFFIILFVIIKLIKN